MTSLAQGWLASRREKPTAPAELELDSGVRLRYVMRSSEMPAPKIPKLPRMSGRSSALARRGAE